MTVSVGMSKSQNYFICVCVVGKNWCIVNYLGENMQIDIIIHFESITKYESSVIL